jgi:DNA-binding NarL/FixJ family response regulator
VDESGAVPWPDGAGSQRDSADAVAPRGAVAGEVVGTAAGARADGGLATELGAAAPITAAALTKREREIALLVASGLSNRDIATRLFISKRTVDAHVEHIFAKLEISSRVKLTMWLQAQVRMGG